MSRLADIVISEFNLQFELRRGSVCDNSTIIDQPHQIELQGNNKEKIETQVNLYLRIETNKPLGYRSSPSWISQHS